MTDSHLRFPLSTNQPLRCGGGPMLDEAVKELGS